MIAMTTKSSIKVKPLRLFMTLLQGGTRQNPQSKNKHTLSQARSQVKGALFSCIQTTEPRNGPAHSRPQPDVSVALDMTKATVLPLRQGRKGRRLSVTSTGVPMPIGTEWRSPALNENSSSSAATHLGRAWPDSKSISSYNGDMPGEKTYYVYIMANQSRTLYIGLTNNIKRRVFEHKNRLVEGFSCRYKIDRLVYVESFGDVYSAIAREKQIKHWRREKKLQLIAEQNPDWRDLSDGW
jgi:putative endonuclease